MSPDFKKRIVNGYFKNKLWVKVIKLLDKKHGHGKNAVKLFFTRKTNGLIYKLNYITGNYAY